jgi:hypothetical protein
MRSGEMSNNNSWELVKVDNALFSEEVCCVLHLCARRMERGWRIRLEAIAGMS